MQKTSAIVCPPSRHDASENQQIDLAGSKRNCASKQNNFELQFAETAEQGKAIADGFLPRYLN